MLMDLIIADIAVGIAIGVSVGFTLRLGILAAVTFRVVLVLLLTIATVIKAVRPLAAAGQDLSAGSAAVIVDDCIVQVFTVVVGAAQIEAADVAQGILVFTVRMLFPILSVADAALHPVICDVPGFFVPDVVVLDVVTFAAHGFLAGFRGEIMGFALRLIIVTAVTFVIVHPVVQTPVAIFKGVGNTLLFGTHSTALADRPMLLLIPDDLFKGMRHRHGLPAPVTFASMGSVAQIFRLIHLVQDILAHIADAVGIVIFVQAAIQAAPMSAHIAHGIVITAVGDILPQLIGMLVILLRMGVGRRGGQQAEHQRQGQHKA